jgi:hypothetical protein
MMPVDKEIPFGSVRVPIIIVTGPVGVGKRGGRAVAEDPFERVRAAA